MCNNTQTGFPFPVLDLASESPFIIESTSFPSIISITSQPKAFGWEVIDIIEGNDVDSIIKGLSEAKSKTGKGKPVCVLLHTEMGNGIDFMMHHKIYSISHLSV